MGDSLKRGSATGRVVDHYRQEMDNKLCMRAYLQLGSWQMAQAGERLDEATIARVLA